MNSRHTPGTIVAPVEPVCSLREPASATGRSRSISRPAHAVLAGHRINVGPLLHRPGAGEKRGLLGGRPGWGRLLPPLEQEFEIGDRHNASDRKLKLVTTTAQTLLEMTRAQRTLRVEWYIVTLIVVEIGLTIYELFLH